VKPIGTTSGLDFRPHSWAREALVAITTALAPEDLRCADCRTPLQIIHPNHGGATSNVPARFGRFVTAWQQNTAKHFANARFSEAMIASKGQAQGAEEVV